MIYESLKLVEKGETIVRNIVLYSEIANPSVYICKKGEKQYDRIFYVKKGNFFLQNSGSGGKCVEAGKGSVIYLPYDVEYKSYWNTKSEGEYVSFNFLLSDSHGNHINLSDGYEKIAEDNSGRLMELFEKSYECYLKHGRYADILLQSYFYRILYSCIRRFDERCSEESYEGSPIYKAMVYLNDNFISDIEIEELAKISNMNVSTFRNEFKKYNGISPLKYKNKLKMRHAKELLESGLYTVSEVADSVNCTDISHLNKLYKAEFGVTPSSDLVKI